MKVAPYIAVIILIILLFLQRECREPITHTETITDTLVQIDTIYQPEVIYRDTGSVKVVLDRIFDTVIDTVYIKEIVYEHFAKNFYSDTLLKSKEGFVVVNDTIFRNKILSRASIVNIFKQPIQRKVHFYAGLGFGGRLESASLVPSLLMINKKEHIYSLSYDVVQRNVLFTFYYKLK